MMLYALSVVLLLLSIWLLAGDNWTEPRKPHQPHGPQNRPTERRTDPHSTGRPPDRQQAEFDRSNSREDAE